MRKILVISVLSFLVILSLSSIVFAENSENAAETVGKLIDEGKIAEAREKIDEYLKKDPNNVDALMMKGNVILNEYLEEKGYTGVSIITNPDESIFNSNLGLITAPKIEIDRNKVNEIASYWKRCLELDKKRLDIHKGLCYLYSLGGMKEELIEQMKDIKQTFPDKTGELMYSMGDYARMFKERDRFEDCIQIYKETLKLFPNEATIYSDLAGVYALEGYWKEAGEYVDIALKKDNPDDMVYGNAIFIFTVLGDYDKVLEATKSISKIEGSNVDVFFDGLYLYYKGDQNWASRLNEFIEKSNEKDGEKAIELSEFLVSKENRNDYESYLKSLDIGAKGAYAVLLHRRAIKKFPDKFTPLFNYALQLTYYKKYDTAIPIFEKIEKGNFDLSQEEKEDADLYYAWALQDSHDIEKANSIWPRLMDSDNFYVRSAAIYFYGKNLIAQGKKDEAKKLFKQISDKASESKYAAYCARILEEMESK